MNTLVPFLVIISIALISLVVILIVYFHRLINSIPIKQCKEDIIKEYISLERESRLSKEVQGIITRIRIETRASKVVINRFHNGGKFANGIDMKKFTTTHETANGSTEPLMDRCVGVLNSRYPTAFEMLAATTQWIVSDVDDCIDMNYKADMKKYGFKASYLFIIRQLDGKDEGFIGLNFSDTHVMSQQERDIVKEQIPLLLGLINMIEV